MITDGLKGQRLPWMRHFGCFTLNPKNKRNFQNYTFAFDIFTFKISFWFFQYDTYDNGTFITYFCTFERLFLTLPMLKLAILKTWDFGSLNFWFCTFKAQAQHFIIMQMNIHRPIEYIWDKQNSTVLLNKLVPYLWQLESHRS